MTLLRRGLSLLATAIVIVLLTGSPAAAHEPGTTSIELQIDADKVTAQIDVETDLLEETLGTDLPTDALSLSAHRDLVAGYLADHFSLRGADGAEWVESAGTLTAVRVDGVQVLRLMVTSTPESDEVVPASFTIAYDGILESDSSHLTFVTAVGLTERAGLVGIIDDQTSQLTVDVDRLASPAALEQSGSTFVSMIQQGFDHVLDGADHLLFLLVLLLPAPLAAVAGRWQPGGTGRESLRKVLHVATAFFIGHSITLAASALGWVTLPSRPVEILVAASVAVAAVHAIWPLTARGEPLIAGGFGLIHGLAFSTLLTELSLGRTTSLVSLLGFNLGVELAQLVFLACAFPCVWLVARTGAYPRVRIAAAGFALLISTSWIVERLVLVDNPFAPVESFVIDRLWMVGVLLAVAAMAIRLVSARQPGPVRPAAGPA